VHHLLSAFEAGIIMVFLTNPLWLIKTRMQLQPGIVKGVEAGAGGATGAVLGGNGAIGRNYQGIWHAVTTIVREEGPLALYKGETCRVPGTMCPPYHRPLVVLLTYNAPCSICRTKSLSLVEGVFPAVLLTSHGAIQFVVYEWLKTAIQPYNLPSVSYSVVGGVAKIIAGLATYPYQVSWLWSLAARDARLWCAAPVYLVCVIGGDGPWYEPGMTTGMSVGTGARLHTTDYDE
jgi:solute carrier family 25 (mitochondrial folate transporter), member 32